jgi:tetratricopeptide (TPR) repeat protein
VHYLLTGAARGRGRQLALYAELSDVATGHVAWARTFQGELGELGTVEGPLLRDVVSALHGSVLAREVARARAQPLHGLESHTLMVSAIALMHSLAPPEFERARALLEHLVDRCPRHSVPHAWFAHLETLRFQQGDAPESARKAREHAATALRHDAACGVSLAMDGYAALHTAGDLRRAAERYAQVLAMQPEDSLTQLLQAEVLALQGDGEQARRLAASALEVPPLGPMQPFYDRIAALAAFAAGEMTEAQDFAQRAVLANPRSVPAQYMLLAAQAAAGDVASARATAAGLVQDAPQLSVADYAARVPACALRDRLTEALARGGLVPG